MVKLSRRILKNKMAERNFKQEALAEQLGISVRHLRNLCYKDTDVAVSLCYRLSRIFEVPMEELLEIQEEIER